MELLAVVSGLVYFFSSVAIFSVSEKTTESRAIKIALLICVASMLFLCVALFVAMDRKWGQPRTTISNGIYPIVGIIEAQKEKDDFLYFVLSEKNDNRLYAFPKDRVVVAEIGIKPAMLMVTQKQGIKKIVLSQ